MSTEQKRLGAGITDPIPFQPVGPEARVQEPSFTPRWLQIFLGKPSLASDYQGVAALGLERSDLQPRLTIDPADIEDALKTDRAAPLKIISDIVELKQSGLDKIA